MSTFADHLRQPCTVRDCTAYATYRVFWNAGKTTSSALMCDHHAYEKNREVNGNASLFALND